MVEGLNIRVMVFRKEVSTKENERVRMGVGREVEIDQGEQKE